MWIFFILALSFNSFATGNDNYDFQGIAKVNSCSGALIIFTGLPLKSKAMVLTNGHCLGRPYIAPSTYILNKPIQLKLKISNNKKEFKNVTAKKILYATITGTDVALFELNETYQQLLRLNIKPFLLSPIKPTIQMPIDIISGLWQLGYSCFIEDLVFKLKEGDWLFKDSIRYSELGCNTASGTSGSPILASGERIVVGIHNTTNSEGKNCLLNSPCEIDVDGNIVSRLNYSYGQQTYLFYNCLSPDYKIDLTRPSCQLQK